MSAPAATLIRPTGADEVAVAASRLLGSWCTFDGVLSERRPTTGGSALVVALATADGTEVVAKRGEPELVSAGFQAQSAAAAAISDNPNGVLRVPRALAAAPGLAISERAPGIPLTASMRRGDAGAIRLTGRALAELAELPSTGRPSGLADHLEELVTPKPSALTATGLPAPLVVMVERLAHAALAAEVPGPAGLVHRDMHPRQVLRDGPRIWLVDWDLAACGDPALDLANLIQHTRHRLAPSLADRVVGLLLEGYAPSYDVLRRLPALEAFTTVRLACKAARLYGAAAAADVTTLVARGRAALSGGR